MRMIIQYMQLKGNIDDLLKTLEKETTLILNRFNINEMKSNDDKCHLLVTLRNENIEQSSSVELIGGNIDINVNFDEHVTKH